MGTKRSGTGTEMAKPDNSIFESTIGITPVTAKRKESRNIWEEYYPLIEPARQYHHHRNDHGSSSYFFHGMFSSDVMCAYRDAVIAYLIAAISMTVLSLTGLVFCKQWGLPAHSPIVFACRCVWMVSPVIGALSLRASKHCNRTLLWECLVSMCWYDAVADTRLQACNTPAHWNIPPFHHLFKCFPTRAMLRLPLLSYAIPVLCEVAAFAFTAATRMVNPVGWTVLLVSSALD